MLSPCFVAKCDNCGKTVLGSGYYSRSIAADTGCALTETEICRDCCEIEYAQELADGTYSLDYLARPLF